jgi:hypothetical protein
MSQPAEYGGYKDYSEQTGRYLTRKCTPDSIRKCNLAGSKKTEPRRRVKPTCTSDNTKHGYSPELIFRLLVPFTGKFAKQMGRIISDAAVRLALQLHNVQVSMKL